MKKTGVLLLMLHLCCCLPAQMFWLRPDKYMYAWNDLIRISFISDEKTEGENIPLSRQDFQSMRLYFGHATDDLLPVLPQEKAFSFPLKIMDEGSVVITFTAQKKLPGPPPVGIRLPVENTGGNEPRDSVFIFVHEQAKTIFQVGTKPDNTFKQQTNLQLDILPQQHPYFLKNGQSLELKVLFQNKPLAMHPVNIQHRLMHHTAMDVLLTDENGMLKLPIQTTGLWLIVVTKYMLEETHEATDRHLYQGSLNWGYE